MRLSEISEKDYKYTKKLNSRKFPRLVTRPCYMRTRRQTENKEKKIKTSNQVNNALP